MSTNSWLRIFGTALLAVVALAVAACGSSRHADPAATTAGHLSDPSPSAVVVRIGTVPITEAVYQHWMAIGAATVEMPKPRGALPKVLTYTPPDFTACASELHASSPHATTAQLQARCRKTYEGIRARILTFLITGNWLRDEAVAQHISVTASEVQKKFAEERNADGTAAFGRLRQASRQTVSDFEFSVATQILSTKLLERFMSRHKGLAEAAAVAGFNRSLTSKWTPRTACSPGYVVRDCRNYTTTQLYRPSGSGKETARDVTP